MIFLSAACRAAGRDVPVADRPLPHERQVLQFALYAGKRFPHIKTRRTHSPGLFRASAGLLPSGPSGTVLKKHPRHSSSIQTVLSVPDSNRISRRWRVADSPVEAYAYGITAGRELHPTLKNVTFYVIICAACAAVFGYLFIIAENVRVSIPHTSGIIFQFFAVSIPSSICQLPEQILKKPVSLNVINVADQMVLRVKTVMVVILRDRRAHQRVPHETAV